MLTRKFCEVCSREWIPYNYHSKMCSPHCQRIRRNQRNKINYELRKANKEKAVGLCSSCKKPFIQKHPLTKTCSRVCKIDNQLKKGSEWKKKKRLKDPQGVKIARQKWLESRFEPKEVIYCEICEKKIPPKRKNATKTCSKRCGLIYQKKLNRLNANKDYHKKKWMAEFDEWWEEKEAELMREERVCKHCRKPFRRKLYGSNQSLCSDKCVKEVNRIRKRNHYLNNREKMIERSKQWNMENKDKKNSYKQVWRVRHKGETRMSLKRTRII